MAHGKKDGFGYLDGVPIRIHEKCNAPKKVILPVSFHFCSSSSSSVNAQYDFSLENEVLKQTENYQEQLTALESAKVEKVASDIEEFTKLTASDNQPSKINLASDESSTVKQLNDEESNNSVKVANSSYIPAWQHNSILQPQQVSCQSVSNGPESIRRKNFNISDFESESSSPFDYMELQIINDLEELNKVFDMSVEKQSSNQNANIEQNTIGNVTSISQSNFECRNATQTGSRTTIKRTRSHPTVDSIDIHYRNGYEKSGKSENVGFVSSMSLSNSMTHRFADYPNSTSHPLTATTLSSYIPKQNEQTTFHNLGDAKDSHIVACPLPIGIRSCKSISDLSKLKSTIVSSTNSMDLQRPNTPPLRPQNSSNKETVPPALPDPYEELTAEHQKIVLTIEEMGFPRGQVARAVKHLGEDSKKIIEHLCQVQKLTEAGHSDVDAEVALHINEYKIEEAIKFLDLTEQLKGLGFEKNAITRALVQHKNDRDKALDALLS